MSKKALGIVTVLSLVFFGLSALVNLVLFASLALRYEPETRPPIREVTLAAGPAHQKIAHIDLEGMITNLGGGGLLGSFNNVNETKRLLQEAGRDDDVKAVLLRINSPGGEITASDILYHEVKELAAKKPVVAYMDTIGASGGYYIACGATYLMANDTTMTGSIGVIIQSLNYKELLGKVGLDAVVFTSGKFKDMLSPSREMREDERAYIQGMVDEMYDRFVGIVSDARKIPMDELRNGVADGRILTGSTALEAKLIDATGYVEQAYEKAKELAGIAEARIVRYAPPLGLGSLLGILGSAAQQQASNGGAQKIELDLHPSSHPPLQPGTLYLLPAHFAW